MDDNKNPFSEQAEEKQEEIIEEKQEEVKEENSSEEIAEENACRFEHAITPELLSVMKNFLDN